MRLLAGYLAGAATITLIWAYGARILGRLLAVPDDIDGRRPMAMVRCSCGKLWPSELRADDCHDQDEMEADDRAHDRLYGINRPDATR